MKFHLFLTMPMYSHRHQGELLLLPNFLNEKQFLFVNISQFSESSEMLKITFDLAIILFILQVILVQL